MSKLGKLSPSQKAVLKRREAELAARAPLIPTTGDPAIVEAAMSELEAKNAANEALIAELAAKLEKLEEAK